MVEYRSVGLEGVKLLSGCGCISADIAEFHGVLVHLNFLIGFRWVLFILRKGKEYFPLCNLQST